MLCSRKTLTTFLSISGEYNISCISARVVRISVKYVLVNFSLKDEQRTSRLLRRSVEFLASFPLNNLSIAFVTSDLSALST